MYLIWLPVSGRRIQHYRFKAAIKIQIEKWICSNINKNLLCLLFFASIFDDFPFGLVLYSFVIAVGRRHWRRSCVNIDCSAFCSLPQFNAYLCVEIAEIYSAREPLLSWTSWPSQAKQYYHDYEQSRN